MANRINTLILKEKPELIDVSLNAIDIAEEMIGERKRQFAKFGWQELTPAEFIMITVEELGEVARAAIDFRFNKELSTQQRTEKLANYREELVQLGAMAIQMIQHLDHHLASEGAGHVKN